MEIPIATLQAMIIASSIGTLSAIRPATTTTTPPKGQKQVEIPHDQLPETGPHMGQCPNCGRG